MMSTCIFLARSVRIQIQNNRKKSCDSPALYNSSFIIPDVGVTMNVVNPGVTKTGIHRHMPFRQSAFIGLTFSPFIWFLMKAAEDGAQSTIFCCVAEALTTVSGQFYK